MKAIIASVGGRAPSHCPAGDCLAITERRGKIRRRHAQDLVGLTKLRFSRSRAFIFSAISVGMPARAPLSTSDLLTHSFSVCAEHPILAAIETIACQRDPCWPSLSSTRRTARSRTSGENLFVVLLIVLHPTQELEPPANTERFSLYMFSEPYYTLSAALKRLDYAPAWPAALRLASDAFQIFENKHILSNRALRSVSRTLYPKSSRSGAILMSRWKRA